MSPKESRDIIVTPHFKFIAKIVLTLTVGSGLGYAAIVLLIKDPSQDVRTLATVASTGWTSGLGALLGLVSGKHIA